MSRKKWLLVGLGIVLLLGGGGWYWHHTQTQRTAAQFINQYHVADAQKNLDDTRYWLEFAHYVTVPASAKAKKQQFILRYEQMKDGTDNLVFVDRENDDAYWPIMIWRPLQHEWEVQYSYTDLDSNDGIHAVNATYKMQAGKFTQKKFKYKGLTARQAKQVAKEYLTTMQYIQANILHESVAQEAVRQLHTTAAHRVQLVQQADKRRERKNAQNEATAMKTFFAQTYRPRFTVQQWQKYIRLRAQQLAIEVANITVHNYTDVADQTEVSLPYGYRQTGCFGYEADGDDASARYAIEIGTAGCLSDYNSKGTVQKDNYIVVTATSGAKYLVVLPLALYNEKTAAKLTPLTANFYYLPDMSSYSTTLKGDWGREFVLKDAKPSAELISRNIVLAAPAEK